MAQRHPSAFDRAFTRRDLFRGPARWSALLAVLGSLLLCGWLFNLYLLVDLLDTRGRLVVSAADAERLPAVVRANGNGAPPEARAFSNSGLLPTVWWSRDKWWGEALERAYNAVPLLRENNRALITLLLLGLLLGALRILCLSRVTSLAARAGIEVATRLRRTLHRQTLRLGPSDLVDTEAAQVHALFTDDVDRVREGVTLWIKRLHRHPVELVILLAFAISIHWRVALLCLLPLAACWYLLDRERQRWAASKQRAQSQADADLRLLGESFRKARLVRGYGMEQFEHEQFQKYLDRFRDSVSRVRMGEVWSRWGGRALVMLAATVVLFLVGTKVLFTPDELSLAAAVTLLLTFAWMNRPLSELRHVHDDRQAASLAADRVFRYLDRIPEVGQAVGAKFLEPVSKSIQFESVHYALSQGRPLLSGLDLRIPAGSTYAVVSLDPIEARALAYLLPRFIEPQKGRVLFDGEDIAWVTLESLRAEAVYVGGTDPFFTGTVAENISCGNTNFSLQDVTAAAKQAHAHNFVQKLAQGYETVLGEHGEQLDAGQSFRLGLARAILRKPALLIIEEPATGLDDDTKSMLDDTYNRITRDRTVIFLPTRLSTLRRADQIVFLHKGRVEAIGKHGELVRQSPLYRHWEYVRFNEFRQEVEAAV